MRYLRSRLGGHIAGTGIVDYFDYHDTSRPSYKGRYRGTGYGVSINPVVPGVTLPNEDPKRWAELSGPCMTVVGAKK